MKNIFTLCIILTFLSVKSQVQKSVKIGNQEWTSENLSVSKFRNGDIINQSKTKDGELKSYDNDGFIGPEFGFKYIKMK